MEIKVYNNISEIKDFVLPNSIINENCTIAMQKIKDNSIDMVLTDLPYGTTQCKWDNIIPFDIMWKELKRIVKKNGAICLFGIEPFSSLLRCSNIKNFKYDWIWDKVKSTGYLNAQKQPMRCYEIISVFYEKQCMYNPQKTNGHIRKISFKKKELQTEVYGKTTKDYLYDSSERYPRNIQIFSTDTQNTSIHPTQKPLRLCEYFIKTYTKEGDTVLDFTMGSGTTGEACINTGRNFIGIEWCPPPFKKDKYFRTAETRIKNATLQNNLF